MVLECVTNFVRIYNGSLARVVENWAREAGYHFRVQRRSLSLWVPQVRERVALIFLRNDCKDVPAWTGLDRTPWEHDPGAPEVTLSSCGVREDEAEDDPALALSPDEVVAYLRTPSRMPSPCYPRILALSDVAPRSSRF